VYAIAAPAVRAPLGEGLAGEPLTIVELAGVAVIAGSLPAAAPLDEPSLRGHDRTVRALSKRVGALLPARFGSFLSERELRARLEPHAQALTEALARVTGCHQMTLRFFTDPSAVASPSATGSPGAGPGERWLRARAAASLAGRVAPLLRALAPFVREGRLVEGERQGLLGSALHLVAATDHPRYARTLASAERSLPGIAVRATGPWPPYGFAPEVLA
jgi:hypothetical protein